MAFFCYSPFTYLPTVECITAVLHDTCYHFNYVHNLKLKESSHMSLQTVLDYFRSVQREGDVLQFESSSATVEEAAATLQVHPARIAKTLSFRGAEEGNAILIVAAGDAKIDNKKFKAQFQLKPRMLDAEAVVQLTGHPVGGVCPFALATPMPVYIDISVQRFATVFPACGSRSSAIELSPAELFEHADAIEFVDICKDWDDTLA